MKIIQLSDLHLLGDDRPLFGGDPTAHLQAAVADILAHHADAAFCLLTGDLTNAGEEAAYHRLAEALACLPMPVWPLPGNHDDRAILARHFPRLSGQDNGFLHTRLDTPAGCFLLLDTLEAGFTEGALGHTRLAWLRAQLDSSDDRPLWIAMHHPPFAVGIPSMDRYALRDPEVFWLTLAPHRARIRHLFLGHLHRPIGGSWRGIPFSCIRSTSHQVALDLATCPANGDVPGSHEAPGYAVILIDDERVIVHHHEFMSQGEPFWF